MARFKCSNRILLFPIMIGLPLVSCSRHSYHYTGDALASPHPWLKNKRVFLDTGYNDPPHAAPGPCVSSTNEAGRRVSLILEGILKDAGASVETSRGAASIAERAEMARRFSPDILLGIRESDTAGELRLANRPLILIGDPRELRPASFDFALILMTEFRKIMDDAGFIAVDTPLSGEDRGSILRETSALCPGVIGIPACYPGIDHSLLSGQAPYLEKLAEACFFALSSYFKRGVPSAKVSFSCPVDTTGPAAHLVRDRKPSITIHTVSGNDATGIDEGSLRVSLDGLALKYRKITDTAFSIDYGTLLHPGHHLLRFQFRNLRGQSSMPLAAHFTVEPLPGDLERLMKDGTSLIRRRGREREGLAMLLTALSSGCVRTQIDALLREIIRGFYAIGDRNGALHFTGRLSMIYPVPDAAIPRRAPLSYDGCLSQFDRGDKEVPVTGGRRSADTGAGKIEKRTECGVKRFFSGQ